MSRPSAIWVLADDRAGNVGQCLGVAEALGLPFSVREIRYTRLGALPNAVRGATRLGVCAASRQSLSAPWPDLVIAAGRRTAPVARWIKRQCGARLVQIMDPGPGGRQDFDLIAVPRHDGHQPAGDNVLPILGAPHRVTVEKLESSVARWQPVFAPLPRPWIAVSVGGSTRKRPFTAAMAMDLGQNASAMAAALGGSLLLTTSRRTGPQAQQALMQAITVPHHAHLWGSGGDNPYFGYLALADRVVVTGDSVSMVCEACATARPVYLFAPPALVVEKHFRLHQQLYRLGYARPLRDDSAGDEDWTHPPLNAAQDVAAAIRERFYPSGAAS